MCLSVGWLSAGIPWLQHRLLGDSASFCVSLILWSIILGQCVVIQEVARGASHGSRSDLVHYHVNVLAGTKISQEVLGTLSFTMRQR